jgi:hypothetical protein
MIPEEAKRLWCPFVRLMLHRDDNSVFTNPTGYNKLGDNKCIANGCMMWRWIELPGDGHGFCGLGGKP